MSELTWIVWFIIMRFTFQPTFKINYGKDFTHDVVEVVANGPPGSTVYISAVDYEFLMRGALPFITEQKVSFVR